jgi:chaperone required for assembly of F1-ATPase
MNKQSILNLDLDFEMVDKKYYLTLAGKRLKTKEGNEIYCNSLMNLKAVQDDYKISRFKSKWINLASSYVDFVANDKSIEGAKDQIKSYFKNDLLFYLDKPNSEFYAYQAEKYVTLIDQFVAKIKADQKIIPTTDLGTIRIKPETLAKLDELIEELSLQQLFIALFLTRISTSSILTLLYLLDELSVEEFYSTAFYSELDKLNKANDAEEAKRLEIIKQELEILNYFKEN